MRRSVTCSAKGIIWKPEMLMAFMLAIVKQRRQTVSLRTTIGTMGWAARRSMRISSGKSRAKRKKNAISSSAMSDFVEFNRQYDVITKAYYNFNL